MTTSELNREALQRDNPSSLALQDAMTEKALRDTDLPGAMALVERALQDDDLPSEVIGALRRLQQVCQEAASLLSEWSCVWLSNELIGL